MHPGREVFDRIAVVPFGKAFDLIGRDVGRDRLAGDADGPWERLILEKEGIVERVFVCWIQTSKKGVKYCWDRYAVEKRNKEHIRERPRVQRRLMSGSLLTVNPLYMVQGKQGISLVMSHPQRVGFP